MIKKRTSGILMHITSLPSEYGIGDFGPGAEKFADFINRSGMHIWQVLPLNITKKQQGFSPYNCFSAFAGNPLLISPKLLVKQKLLNRKDIEEPPKFPATQTDYSRCAIYKKKLFKKAFQNFQKVKDKQKYQRFIKQNQYWLEDFSLFMALKEKYGNRKWSLWPENIKNRRQKALQQAKNELERSISYHNFIQYIFTEQYFQLKNYCSQKSIQLFGDLPIYVTYDSADVWANPHLFKLDRAKKPKFIAGVPPDYFSKTGQLWGNPVYNWPQHQKENYQWWFRRLQHNFRLFDLLRIDHFRAFEAYWQVPAYHKTAIKGRWVKGPDYKFFRALIDRFPQPPVIVEDLGEITPAVRELIAKFSFPTMKVLQFAFDGSFVKNIHIPHNHLPNSLVYTGTHDNNTTRGWYTKDLSKEQKKNLRLYLGQKITAKTVAHQLIRMAMQSVSNIAIIPAQDILNLDQNARMNNPATAKNNWKWRMKPNQLKPDQSRQLKNLVKTTGRL